MATISSHEALLALQAGHHAFIDVRSEGEFAQGALPRFHNLPILTDSERHQVGLTYKQKGQNEAIRLGHELVDPHRTLRVNGWAARAKSSLSGETIIACWRGGLRSEIAMQWLCEAGIPVQKVQGGYKAMRHELLKGLQAPPPLLVLSGLTGSGKTQLLMDLPLSAKLNLEGLACHRGSSFGAYLHAPQPSQATFENEIGWVLWKHKGPVVTEDEGVSIGSIHLPPAIRAAIVSTPIIYLEIPFADRVANICKEYVLDPLLSGITPEMLQQRLMNSLTSLTRRLGGALTTELVAHLQTAFATDPQNAVHHEPWISPLLSQYYDKGYTYAFKRSNRSVRFSGNYEECRQWILAQYA